MGDKPMKDDSLSDSDFNAYVHELNKLFDLLSCDFNDQFKQKGHSIYFKNEKDYATECDYEIESTIRKFLAEKFDPSWSILGEEEGGEYRTKGFQWIIDPIDGTINFNQGIPLCGINLSLNYDGMPILAIIDFPILRERYLAGLKKGSFINGNKIGASPAKKIDQSIVTLGDFATGTDCLNKNVKRLLAVNLLANNVHKIKMLGCAAVDYCWLSSGKTDIHIMFSNNPWDVQAGVLIAQESGKAVFDLDGKPYSHQSKEIICSSHENKADLLNLLRSLA
jgi:myo-inositol-1(or 4)-monophosphatase